MDESIVIEIFKVEDRMDTLNLAEGSIGPRI